jgi:threonine/homoserine efflux transporter RhtA
VLLFIVFLQRDAYVEIQAASRVTTGVLLAAILCFPFLAATAARRWWVWACSALWLALTPFWLLFPALPWYLHVARLARGG